MDKKKTSYYYNKNTEDLIKKGMSNYKRKNYGTELKLSSFIDMCIEEAVEKLPSEIQKLNDEKLDLMRKNIQYEKQINRLEHLISRINRNMNERTVLNEAIQEVINSK